MTDHDANLTEHVAAQAVGVDASALAEATTFIEAELARTGCPGAVLLAARHGKIFIERYWGTCCTATRPDQPYDGDRINMLYSFSKGVTATVVVMVHQDGLLDYDQPVCDMIPEFTGQGREQITLRHCLTHSAGIPKPELPPAYGPEGWSAAVAAVCRAELEWPPGSRTEYHGTSGMLLAAEAARRVSGAETWNDLCHQRLFAPLGAETLNFEIPADTERIALAPWPKELPRPIEPAKRHSLGHPGAGAFGRPIDALKLIQLHLNGGIWDGKVLIRADALAEMHRVQFASQIEQALAQGSKPAHEYWGLGWMLRGRTERHWFGFGRNASENAFGHAGISTVIGIGDPGRGVGLVFITTDTPGDGQDDVVTLRNGVTDRVIAAVR